jgi:hypothetical protein
MTLDGATISGSPVTLASGTATLNVTTSATGTHTLKAVYNGDANWAAGTTASITYTVTVAAAKCDLCGVTSHPEPIIHGPRIISFNPQ